MPYVDAGMPIVVLEPSCWSVLRDEIQGLFPERKETKAIRENIFLFSEFLVQKANYHPPRLHMSGIVHGHCHHKALMHGVHHEKQLLDNMQMKVRVLADGCCGMAGAFGFEEEHYDVSAKVGEHAFLPAVRSCGLNEVVIADGFSCREQISQMTQRHGLHMAEVLQLAIQQGPAAVNGMPEKKFVDGDRRAVQKSKMEAVAVLGGAVAVVAGALGAYKLFDASRSNGKSVLGAQRPGRKSTQPIVHADSERAGG